MRLAAFALIAGVLATAAAAQETPAPQPVDVSVRARALGLSGPERFAPPDLGIEAQRAPTGAGVSRWPTNPPPGSAGFYVGPACLPGDLDYMGPVSRSRPGRRGAAAPTSSTASAPATRPTP